MNNFKVHINEENTNVLTDAEYTADTQRKNGFVANDLIKSKILNSELRQSTLVTYALCSALMSNKFDTTLSVGMNETLLVNWIQSELNNFVNDNVIGNVTVEGAKLKISIGNKDKSVTINDVEHAQTADAADSADISFEMTSNVDNGDTIKLVSGQNSTTFTNTNAKNAAYTDFTNATLLNVTLNQDGKITKLQSSKTYELLLRIYIESSGVITQRDLSFGTHLVTNYGTLNIGPVWNDGSMMILKIDNTSETQTICKLYSVNTSFNTSQKYTITSALGSETYTLYYRKID